MTHTLIILTRPYLACSLYLREGTHQHFATPADTEYLNSPQTKILYRRLRSIRKATKPSVVRISKVTLEIIPASQAAERQLPQTPATPSIVDRVLNRLNLQRKLGSTLEDTTQNAAILSLGTKARIVLHLDEAEALADLLDSANRTISNSEQYAMTVQTVDYPEPPMAPPAKLKPKPAKAKQAPDAKPPKPRPKKKPRPGSAKQSPASTDTESANAPRL